MLLFVGLLLILVFFVWRFPRNVKSLPKSVADKARTCVLLTMHATPDRRLMYNDIISKWLSTNFDIFTVDSANHYSFSRHPRWKALAFEQGFAKQDYSVLELRAIKRAVEFFDFSHYDIVYKITGKYFIPDLEDLNVPKAELLVQQKHNFMISYQNCEIYGFKPSVFDTIEQMYTRGAEQTLFKASLKLNTYRLPSLSVTTRYPRGDGSILTYL